MKSIRGIYLLVMLTFVLVSLYGSISSASAAEIVPKNHSDARSAAQNGTRKTQSDTENARFIPSAAAVKPTIHALLVIMDGDPNNFKQYEASARWMNDLLLRGKNLGIFDVKKTTFSSSKGSEDSQYPTPTRILDWIVDVKPRKHDVVFVYYCGHGASDRGDYFDLVGQRLHEVEVVNTLKRSPAATCRLQILIVDTCRVDISIEGPKGKVSMSPATGYKAGRAYNHLFVEHTGFLHLASASQGQPSWGDASNGGWFTNGLIRSIYSHPDANGRFVGWNEIFAMAEKEVEKFLKENSGIVGTQFQQPKVHSLPNRLSSEQLAMWINEHNSTADSQEESDTDRTSSQNSNTSRYRGANVEIGDVKLKLEGAKFKIRVPFKIHNLRNQEVDVIAVFYQRNGQPFENVDKKYGLTDGAVATWATVDSASEEAILSMPTRELHLTTPGKYPFSIGVVIRLPESNKELGRTTSGSWTYTFSR